MFLSFKFAKILLIIVGSFLLSYYLLGNNLDAKWGIIDDHEIMYFLGSDGEVKINKIVPLILETEVGKPGTSLRYRPSYYLLRISEAFLWGDSSLMWYLCRFFLFTASASILWWIIASYIGLVPSMLFVLYVFSYIFWADIWARLGPAEIYAAFGTAIYCLGYINCLREINKDRFKNNTYSLVNLSLVLIGALIAVGSKENFLLLLIPSSILFYLLWEKKLLNKIVILYSSAIFGYGLFIMTVVIVALAKAKKDIYANDVAPFGRMKLAVRGVEIVLSNHNLLFILSFVMLVVAVTFLYLSYRKDYINRRLLYLATGRYFIILFGLMILYVSQFVFYNGNWPKGDRYDFPGVLVEPFFILVTVLLFINLCKIVIARKIWSGLILTLVSVWLVFQIKESNGFNELRNRGLNNASQTRLFTSKLNSTVNILKGKPESAVLFESHAPGDYEPVSSVSRYLRANGVKNPLYLKFYGSIDIYPINSLENFLINDLQDVSVNGGRDGISWDFRPINELLEKESDCYSISFSGPRMSNCRYIVQIR